MAWPIFLRASADKCRFRPLGLPAAAVQPPLRSLPLEYPPLSIVAFSLTLLPPLPDYITVFALWMLALLAAFYLAFKRFESVRAAEVVIVYSVVGGLSTLLGPIIRLAPGVR